MLKCTTSNKSAINFQNIFIFKYCKFFSNFFLFSLIFVTFCLNISIVDDKFFQIADKDKDNRPKVKKWLYRKVFLDEFKTLDFNTCKNQLGELRKSIDNVLQQKRKRPSKSKQLSQSSSQSQVNIVIIILFPLISLFFCKL